MRKLLEHEAEMLRNKPVLADVEHFVMRYIHRASFEKVKEAIELQLPKRGGADAMQMRK